MVVTMKKMQVLLPAADREPFLKELARVGVVHIEERVEESHSVNLEQIGARVKKYTTVFEALEKLVKECGSDGTPKADEDADVLVEQYSALEQQRDATQQRIASIQKDIVTLSPWGNFDPGLIEKLKNADVNVRFFETTPKKFATLALADTPHAVIDSGTEVKFVVFDRGEPSEIDADEVSLPAKSLDSLKAEVAQSEREISEGAEKMIAMVPARAAIKRAIDALEVDGAFERARLSLEEGAKGAVLLLTGWFPVKKEKSLTDFLANQTVWFEITTPGRDEPPPVKLQNDAFSRLFEPITKMFALPDYFELDPTPFFAPFYMFFYGLCLGDVGYGLLILIPALVLIAKGPLKLKGIWILGSLLGAMTIVNGFFLNSFFGASIFDLQGVDGIAGSGGWVPFLGSLVVSGKTEFPAITFAVYIGIVQMLLGMVLQVSNRLRNQGLLYAVQPMCYIPLTLVIVIFLCKVNFLNMGTYTINGIPIGASIAGIPASVETALLLIGIVPFMFLNSPQIRFYLRPLKFLWELYNFVNGIVSNGLSYLRLFALGLAGSLLGKAFNDIALMLVTNEQGDISLFSPLIVFTFLIMIAGHLLNFALSALGAYVHSVRLIFVEFYGNLSFQGGGKPYVPFTENVTNNN
jgi:V/A-type H+-transporting ATPase subunit I